MKMMRFLFQVILLVLFVSPMAAQTIQLTNDDGETISLGYHEIVQVYPDSDDDAVILYGARQNRFRDTTAFDALLDIAGGNLILFTDSNNDDREIAIPVSTIIRITETADNTARIFQRTPSSTIIATYDTGESFTSIQTAVTGASIPGNVLTGGAEYIDTSYRSTPLTVDSAETVTLPNVAQLRYEDELPADLDSLYNTGDSLIIGQAGDILLITLTFDVDANTGDATWIDVYLDVNGTNVHSAPTVELFRGQDVVQQYAWTTSVLVTAAWETNGAKIKVTAGDALDISDDIDLVITRVKKSVN